MLDEDEVVIVAGSSEPMTVTHHTIPRPFYHGTKVDLKPGDLIAPGYSSNYGRRRQASWVYLTGTLDAAIWGAELAAGDGRGRILSANIAAIGRSGRE